ncbi:MAG: hypothetical protein HGJ94_18450 [Desulfosarcina sp.]|nr:hypothetical protein [Desulfosarcina sp.]
MRLTSIRLRGAIGILKGIGVEEIHLNLSDLGGMVALDGDNGTGKTTLLDNLHPYRVLPSRPKKSLQHHFYLRDSFREIELDHDGKHYRFLIKIDPEAGKQEGYIYIDGSTESITTGKVREYDDKVASLFGSLDLFLSSVFCAQKTDDSKMTVGQMKEQWAEFLKLHELQTHSETAKHAAKIIASHISAVTRDTQQREGVLDALKTVPAELKSAEIEAGHNAIRLNAMEDHLLVLDHDLQAAMESEAQDNATRKQIESIGAQIDGVEKDIIELDAEYSTAVDENKDQITSVSSNLDRLKAITEMADDIEAAAGKVAVIDEKMSGLYDQNAHEGKLLADAHTELAAHESGCQQREGDYLLTVSVSNRKAERVKEHIRGLRVGINGAADRIQQYEQDPAVARLQREIDGLDRRAELLRLRPDACAIDGCSFISDALEAQAQREDIVKLLKDRKKHVSLAITDKSIEIDNLKINRAAAAEYARSISEQAALAYQWQEEIREEEKALAKTIYKGINGCRIAAETVETEINNLKRIREKYEALSKKLPELSAAKAEYKALFENLERLNRESKVLVDRMVAETAKKQIIIAALKKERGQLAESIIGGRADQVREKIETIKGYLAMRRETFSTIEKRISTLESDNTRLVVTEREILELEKKRGVLEQEESEWTYLSNGFGKNGLQALEIDNVAPAISSIANDLLASTYGPTMQVSIDTLTESSRETLDTWVIRDDGSKHLLDDFSGGEKVWILKALRLARTIIGKERSGADIRTAFSDEEDGALRHGETSENFIRMFRAFIERADIDSCFYISHKPECIGMADHVIGFGDGALSVQ